MAYLHKSIIYLIRIEVSKGFLQTISGWLSGKDLPAMQETQQMWVRSLGREDPLEERMAAHSSILAW